MATPPTRTPPLLGAHRWRFFLASRNVMFCPASDSQRPVTSITETTKNEGSPMTILFRAIQRPALLAAVLLSVTGLGRAQAPTQGHSAAAPAASTDDTL